MIYRVQEYFQYSQKENNSSYKNFSDMIVDLRSTMPMAFNDGDPVKGTIGILSPKYLLKKSNYDSGITL
jgi:hypothetical protein